jgi:PAS domain S-box-containing protein
MWRDGFRRTELKEGDMRTSQSRRPAAATPRDSAKRTSGSIQAALQRVEHLQSELTLQRIELDVRNEELRLAQLQVEEAQRISAEMFESAPTASLVMDAFGVISRVNPAACALLTNTRVRMIGRPLRRFIAERSRSDFTDQLIFLRRGHRTACELWIHPSNGTRSYVRMDAACASEHGAEIFVTLTDLSERQRRQAALEHSNWELEVRVARYSAAIEAQRRQLQVGEPLRHIGMFAAGIAHDFNNLLQGVIVNADSALGAPALPDALRQQLSLIARTARDAAELTRQLLKPGEPGTISVSLSHVVACCVELMRSRAGAAIDLQLHLDTALPPIAIQRLQLQRVVINILSNAIEAIGDRGAIVVRAELETLDAVALRRFRHVNEAQPGRYAILHIVDSGPGMEPETLQQIFDPFVTTKDTGCGLGLSNVRDIVRSCCGAIQVSTRLGHGTSFEIAFPLAPAQSEPPSASPSVESAPIPSASLLLIDDDHLVSSSVARALRMVGFEVAIAAGGANGIAMFTAAEREFDVVVLDWLMPRITGANVFEELRRLRPYLPIVFTSGIGAERMPRRDELTAWVQKPASPAELCAAIMRVLHARRMLT